MGGEFAVDLRVGRHNHATASSWNYLPMNNLSLWHLIIIGSLIYVVYSIFRLLLKTIRSKSPDSELRESELIINAYGKTLEHLAPVPGTVADESKLPFPKSRIKQAILCALKASQQPTQKQVLKVAYLQLADFQPGVGSKNVGLDLSNVDAARLTQDGLLALANDMASSQDLMASAKAESEQLTAELAAAGY